MENDFSVEVNVSNEVVSIISSIAAGSIEGVAGMNASIGSGFAELLGKKNLSKGVKVEIKEKDVSIDLFITVDYGVKIPEVAWNIQEKVKGDVENMTGLNVTAVNVHVEGVEFDRKKNNNQIEIFEEDNQGESV